LTGCYFTALGAGQVRDLVRLFHWRQTVIEKTLAQMVRQEELIPDWQVESQPGSWFILPSLVS
jgi:hypothetical protein